jgi:hypothetical protein
VENVLETLQALICRNKNFHTKDERGLRAFKNILKGMYELMRK